MVRKELRIPLLILGIIILVLLYFVQWNVVTETDFLVNLATEIIGIFITILFIDSILNFHEKLKQRKIKRVALKQLKFPLKYQLDLFAAMFKAAIEAKPTKYENYNDLFNAETYYKEISHLDLTKESYFPLPQKWARSIYDQCAEFNKYLEKTLDRYLFYLDSDTIELIEKLVNSQFINRVSWTSFLEMEHTPKKDMCGFLKEYLTLLSQFLELYNSELPDDKIELAKDFFTNDVCPPLGSGRNYSY